MLEYENKCLLFIISNVSRYFKKKVIGLHGQQLVRKKDLCRCCVKTGNVKLLNWLNDSNYWFDYKTCKKAAKYGYIDVLKWARTNDCTWNYEVPRNASLYGH